MYKAITVRTLCLPAVVVLFASAILATLSYLYGNVDVWNGLALSVGVSVHDFCEWNGLHVFMRQPINSITNLIYLFYGTLIFVLARNDSKLDIKDKHNFITKYPIYSILVASICVYLFFASFLYHASLSEIGRRLDISGVVAIALMPLSYSILRVYSLINYRESELFFLRTHKIHFSLLILFSFLYFVTDFYGREITECSVLLTIIISIFTKIKYTSIINFKYFVATLIIILLSFVAWYFDKNRLFCNSTSLIQLHAIWHFLSATSIFLIYMFFRSEILFKHHQKLEIQ